MVRRRTVLATVATVSVAGCSSDDSTQNLLVRVANQSGQEITATLVLSRNNTVHFETEITVSGDETWSTQQLEDQQYFAMIALAERDDVAYQGYYAECDKGELTAMVRDSSTEFLQTRCG